MGLRLVELASGMSMVGTFSELLVLLLVVVLLLVGVVVLSVLDVDVALAAEVVDDVDPDPELPQPANSARAAIRAPIEIVFVRAPLCMGFSSCRATRTENGPRIRFDMRNDPRRSAAPQTSKWANCF